MSYFQELKRRNVFRVIAAYLAFSWVIIQVTGEVVPALNLPESIPSIVVWICLIGFPLAVGLSWVYEITPEGLKRESEVDRGVSITYVTGRRLDFIIIAMLAIAILLFALQYFQASSSEETQQVELAESEVAVSATDHAPAPAVASLIGADNKSIAVLPFVNMSSDQEQEYFSDGMSEELLNLLAQIHDLKVIARTSSFAFKGKDVPIAEIAKQLNVAHVLEGSVRKSSDKVRITAQLIRAADSTHLWSESYDRPLDDIFAVQDEIAGAIVQALQIKLSGGELNRGKGGTQNLEAYQLYLRGVSALNQNTQSSLNSAGEYLKQATNLDPNFGQAWSQLSLAVALQADNGYLAPTEGYERTRMLAQRALQVSPDLAEAHALLMYVHIAFDWDWSAAKTEEHRALAIDPTDPWALQIAGLLAQTLGQWSDAERQLHAALVLDPFNAYTVYTLGVTYYGAGRFVESEGTFRKLLELEPGFLWGRGRLAETLLAQGKSEEALAILQKDVDEGSRLSLLPVFLQAVGRQTEADEALQAQKVRWADTGAYYVARAYAYRGDHDRAIEWLERAYQQKDASLTWIVAEPLFKGMADDPRFEAFLRRMNLPLIRPVEEAKPKYVN